VSFHVTTTTFRFPAVCAAAYGTAALVEVAPAAQLLWTNKMLVVWERASL
jgi:hypothetical protein